MTPMAQGTRELDVGTPHQGPISLQGVRGDTPFYLYFTHVPLDPACVDCRRVRTSIATWYSWSIKLRAPLKTKTYQDLKQMFPTIGVAGTAGGRASTPTCARPKKALCFFLWFVQTHTPPARVLCDSRSPAIALWSWSAAEARHSMHQREQSRTLHACSPPHDTRHRAARGSAGRPQPC